MYEKPKLNRVGYAQDTILGVLATGEDMDTLWVPIGQEYADEGDDRESAVLRN
jgi:photosystem II stability/assembly factor-like uncharacterized protein